MQSLAKLQK